MVKNTIIWLVLCFLQFYISSLWGEKNSLNSKEPEPEPEPQGSGFFWPLGAGAEAAWKKRGSGAAWKITSSQSSQYIIAIVLFRCMSRKNTSLLSPHISGFHQLREGVQKKGLQLKYFYFLKEENYIECSETFFFSCLT